jgi:hypothetical protein
MNLFHPHRLAVLLIAIAANACAADTGERGSVPPGQSADGSRASEGAIVGGSPDSGAAATAAQPNAHDVSRCRQLQGSLREQCLRDLDGKPPLGESRPETRRQPGQDQPPRAGSHAR